MWLADFDVVGMKEIDFVALIGVEHLNFKLLVGLGVVTAWTLFHLPYPLVALKLLGNREGENIED